MKKEYNALHQRHTEVRRTPIMQFFFSSFFYFFYLLKIGLCDYDLDKMIFGMENEWKRHGNSLV